MKKLFILIMAMGATISISALPPQKIVTTKSGPAKHQTESAIRNAQQMEEVRTYWTVDETMRMPVPQTDMAEMAPITSTKKVVPLAKTANQDFVELVFDDIVRGPTYYDDTQTWDVGLTCYDESKSAYGHIIQLNWHAPADDFTGSFTTKDFDPDYTWAVTTTCMGYILFDSITMTISKEVVSENETMIVLDAQMIGSDGFVNYAFDVHAEKRMITSTNSVVIPTVDVIIEEYMNGFTVVGSNDDLTLDLAVMTYESVVGTFDLTSIDMENSKIIYKGTDINPVKLEGNIVINDLQGNGWVYSGELAVIGSDYVEYAISFVAPLPEPADTVEISCINLRTDWFDTRITFKASNSTYDIAGSWIADEIQPGTYSGDNAAVHITNKQTYDNYFAKATTIVVSGSDRDGWVLDIKMIDSENVLFLINLSWYVPTITDTIVVAFDNSAKAMFYPDYGNDLQLYNENEQYYASLNVAGLEPGDTFTEDDLFPMYSGVEIADENGEFLPIDYAFVQNGLLSQVEDTTKMYAEYITFDGKMYQVNLWHAVPTTPKNVVDITYENAEFVNTIADGGFYSLIGFSADSLSAFKVSIYATSDEEIPGTFVNDGMFGLFGDGQYEFAGADTYFDVLLDAETGERGFIFADKGEITVSMDDDKNIFLTGWIMGDDAVKYNLTMTSKYQRTHLYYDSEDTPVDRTFTAKDKVRIADYTPQWGPIYFEVLSEENWDLFNFQLLVEEADPETILPEGVYPITDTYDYYTVMAGTGVDPWSGQVAPGLYGAMGESANDLALPLYFLVDGTVEIKNNNGALYIEVNAVNSYDVPVHLVYDASTTALDDIQTPTENTRKIIRNGQLLILHNGETYTIWGARTTQ